MPGYSTRTLLVHVGGHAFRLRVLSDLQQFSDPDGHGERLGISSAQWSLFGQLWPAGRLLAQAMATANVDGKRILEVGCGIGLASLVLQQRGAEIVASDIHPLAEPFLAYNSALNALDSVHYRQMDWDLPLETLGRFDMIIASDVLYERGHAALLADVVERHAQAAAEVVVSDPGRGNSAPFSRHLASLGFSVTESREALEGEPDIPHGRLLHYRRDERATSVTAP
ncbi:class I SAM-dependent methyltransferase [Marilutibacter aestuarii]|uniref:Calmodulin-lysine N-methyltransferase n=1 Tax=Marilutibacter aestuarii TaxID=1706195 RepID=A0A508AKI6_9GAMM|nr:methyltransferase domain-containing protein [Lysobacter aestuarii]TQD47615.1 methyltransferase domain-containing protein [Lysobacter aestuarii]